MNNTLAVPLEQKDPINILASKKRTKRYEHLVNS